jgi:hypothetical protein
MSVTVGQPRSSDSRERRTDRPRHDIPTVVGLPSREPSARGSWSKDGSAGKTRRPARILPVECHLYWIGIGSRINLAFSLVSVWQLADGGMDSMEKIRNESPASLERAVNKHPPFGTKLKESAKKLAVLDCNVSHSVRNNLPPMQLTSINHVSQRSIIARGIGYCTVCRSGSVGSSYLTVGYRTFVVVLICVGLVVWSRR